MRKRPQELNEYASQLRNMPTDGIIRLQHKYKHDGSICSLNKDSCLSVIRYPSGWIYRCFRCGDSGFVSSLTMSPKEAVKQMGTKPKHETVEQEDFKLPHDAISMSKLITSRMRGDDGVKGMADAAYKWLWQYDIDNDDMKEYEIHWSSSYNRIIVPLYEQVVYNDWKQKEKGKLIGWIGRDPNPNTTLKSITKKAKWVGRVYFYIAGDSNIIVIVEDFASAIKVHNATGYHALALLNKSVNKKLIKKLKGMRVIVWLEYDARLDSLESVKQLTSHGAIAGTLTTYKDPKALSCVEVLNLIRNKKLCDPRFK
jgi:hypothetical protein